VQKLAKRLRWLAAAALALAASAVVFGYSLATDSSGIYIVSWQPGTIPMRIKLPSSPALSDGTSQSGSVVAAMQTWNAQINTAQFSAQVLTPTTYDPDDTASDIVMDSTIGGQAFGTGVLAVTLSFRSGNWRVESDIIFNSAYTWDSFRGGQLGNAQDIRRVAMHELGHVLGLKHPDENGQSVAALMNSHVSYSPAIDTVQTDDINGARALYGSPGVTPGNDNFANATTIPSNAPQASGTNVAATAESGEPTNAGEPARRTAWWKWTPSYDGLTTVSTDGSNFDTVLGVYTGSSPSGLTRIGEGDDTITGINRTSRVVFNALRDTTYYFVVDGWHGYNGLITLNINLNPTPFAPGFADQPFDATSSIGDERVFSVGSLTGYPFPDCRWERRAAGTSTWVEISDGGHYSHTATANLFVSDIALEMNGDSFRCVLTNSVATTVSNVATLTVQGTPTAPTLVASPENRFVDIGFTAQFTTVARGYPTPTYQWQRRPAAGGNWSDLTAGAGYAGTTSSTLTVVGSAVQLSADGDQFRCIVTNSAGSVSTGAATMTVVEPSAVVAAATGSEHTLFLRADNSLWGTGTNSFGQLGREVGWKVLVPTRITTGVVAVAAGAYHTLYIKADGTLWGMGNNFDGQLGNGTNTYTDGPYLIATNVVAAAAADSYSVFIRSDGTLWTTGSNPFGANGQSAIPFTPKQVAEDVIAVAAGPSHCLFIKADQSLWGTGARSSGQIPDGSTSTAPTPGPVHFADGISAVAAGGLFTAFLRSDGTLWGCGDSQSGVLLSASGNVRTPVQIASGVSAVAGGSGHLLFKKVDQTLWAIGYNGDGQLGDGSSTNRSTPVQVASSVATLHPGMYHSVFTKTDGSLWGMGSNTNARFGLNPDISNFYDPTRIRYGPFPAAPTLTGSPTGATAVASPLGRAQFSVAASVSSGLPTYRWQRLAASTSTWVDLTDSDAYAGTRTATLTLTHITSGMQGDQYRCVVTNFGGSVTSNAGALTVRPVTDFSSAATADFDGNGTPDMLWRSPSGQTVIVQMNGTALQGYVSFGSIDSSWIIGGTNDFNGDGKTDILWRNTGTGSTIVMIMNGTTIDSVLDLGTIAASWRAVGTGDFNRDGHTDILWRNSDTGGTLITLMNGASYLGVADLGYIDLGWQIVDVADFNRDGQPDILWRNSDTGGTLITLMNGTSFGSVVDLGHIDLSWQIVAAKDFNSDGQPDVLWRNSQTGGTLIVLMNGTSVGSVVSLGEISLAWRIVGIGDFNRDGKVDVAWRNTESGQTIIVAMNQTSVGSVVDLGLVDP
jgi:alpha-tubulin suppressor-like RCC1 family protein